MEKTLLIFYSYSGNTKSVANYIKEKLNCDILELKPKIPYSDDYNTVVNQGQEEVNNRFTPELEKTSIDLKKYDTLILGSPIWWYTFAPVMRSFLINNDLTGKKIYSFYTNGGYGIGHSISDLKELAPNSEILDYKDIPFEGNELQINNTKIDEFIERIK